MPRTRPDATVFQGNLRHGTTLNKMNTPSIPLLVNNKSENYSVTSAHTVMDNDHPGDHDVERYYLGMVTEAAQLGYNLAPNFSPASATG